MIKLDDWLDLQVWFFLQMYYWPHYVIGKQDDWKEWTKMTLNGFKSFNICNPHR